ncbi:MAG: hypothetical protein JWP87_4977 [Labilithrix sp.]|nr:hypothetical protein [Labilithrix sp.]
MKKPTSLALPLLALLLTSACNKPPEPLPEDKARDERAKAAATTTTASSDMAPPAMPAAHPAMPGAAATNAAAGPEELAWDAPAAWVSAPNPSPMRKATYKIPKAGGDAEDAELAVSAAAGGVDANIKRWEQQFGDAKAKTEPRTVNGLKVTVVEIKGKIGAGGMMGMPAAAAKDNQMLLGAVVDAGDRQHFFKMVGGEKTVTAAKKDFDKLVASIRAK